MTKIKIKIAGESPEYGTLIEGAEMEVRDEIALVWEERGVCEILTGGEG